ncbi:hypothetical protein L1987_45844 [Smallanthus sonchifolius]|uniref:Uncharacterized protein n=1 Tax=Smallanthus sonchifolius TaxID=185202 RepID=A0ACB9FYQ8_9ASTR|nr:hypothetical protein L1987_45844 [Smallanthus sonchifolius]
MVLLDVPPGVGNTGKWGMMSTVTQKGLWHTTTITWEEGTVEYTAVGTYRGIVVWLRRMGSDCVKGTDEFGWETEAV